MYIKRLPVIVLASILLLSSFAAHAQSSFNTQKDFYFFKVWGFLKYQHPALASGVVDADSAFLTQLPVIDEAKTPAAFNAVIGALLKTLNAAVKLSPAKVTNQGKVLTQNVDYSWYKKDKFLSPAVAGQLGFIYNHRHTANDHYYYTPMHYVAELPHEKKYEFADSINVPYAYRMLAFAKIQAVVDYLYPHKYMMDNNWTTTVKKYIPLFAQAKTRLTYETLLLKLSANLEDTHSFSFYEGMKNRAGILHNVQYSPFDYTIVSGEQVLVTKIIIPEFCTRAGIKPGDIITAVNGKSMAGRINELSQLISASNRNALIYRIGIYQNNLLFATGGVTAKLTYKRNGVLKTTNIEWAGQLQKSLIVAYLNSKPAKNQSIQLAYAAPDIALFNIGDIVRYALNIPEDRIDASIDSILNLAANAKGIIFDMRGYPQWGGFMYAYVYKKFATSANAVHAQYYALNKQDIGTFRLLPETSVYHTTDFKPEGQPVKGKIIIIVNSETLSLSEFQTMQLQQTFPNSITIGEQSAGADGDEKMLPLPGGYDFNFTGNSIRYPDGTAAQRLGVKINKVVHPTVADILQDKDTLMQNAIDIINNK
jgi:C-terminal processing protease CtpA/Prc